LARFLKDYGYYDEKTNSYNIKASDQNAMTLLLVTGAILASVSSGFIGSRFGTRAGLFCCGIAGLAGSILQCVLIYIAPLYVGRLLLGGRLFLHILMKH
jgi:MFS family permease